MPQEDEGSPAVATAGEDVIGGPHEESRRPDPSKYQGPPQLVAIGVIPAANAAYFGTLTFRLQALLIITQLEGNGSNRGTEAAAGPIQQKALGTAPQEAQLLHWQMQCYEGLPSPYRKNPTFE
ncbi:hypothetical protein cyc_00299 [Cyclospora cayetanensis]|uniref:Uncharacterized protein n=1 Tax=Cyclospora cayetanensis TaxID=88456 RepID=A0A1D3D0E1_9EIME|nr:hypothetical protein cyc_00299 [Cyclospora cayetanensis]